MNSIINTKPNAYHYLSALPPPPPFPPSSYLSPPCSPGRSKAAYYVRPPSDFVEKHPELLDPQNLLLLKTKPLQRAEKVYQVKILLVAGHHIVIKAVHMEDTRGYKALMNEYEASRSLDHPYISHVYGVYPDFVSQQLMLVMEGTEYGSIERLVTKRCLKKNRHNPKKHKSLTLEKRKKILKQTLEALSYLHRQGWVHRDLKLENIILMVDGNIRLIDFGLAVPVGMVWPCKVPSEPSANVAPEVFLEAPSTQAVDYWSFGVLLCEVMTGERLRGFDPHITDPSDRYSLTSFIHNAHSVHLPYGQAQGYKVILGCLQVEPWERIHKPDHPYLLEYIGSLEPKNHIHTTPEQSPNNKSSQNPYAYPTCERDNTDYGGYSNGRQYQQQYYGYPPQPWNGAANLPPQYQDPFYLTPHYFPDY